MDWRSPHGVNWQYRNKNNIFISLWHIHESNCNVFRWKFIFNTQFSPNIFSVQMLHWFSQWIFNEYLIRITMYQWLGCVYLRIWQIVFRYKHILTVHVITSCGMVPICLGNHFVWLFLKLIYSLDSIIWSVLWSNIIITYTWD